MINKELWQVALGEIELSISKANYITWFRNTYILTKKDDQIIIGVPNAFTKEWLENKYNKIILKALKNVCKDIKNVTYIMNSQKSEPKEERAKKKENHQYLFCRN